MNKKYWVLIGLIILLVAAGVFVYQKYYVKNSTNETQAECGVANCHGLEIECGQPAEICTQDIESGDVCRQYAECETKNGVCQQKINDNFTTCKTCVETCQKENPNDPSAEMNCENSCYLPNTSSLRETQSQYALPVENFLTGQTKKTFGTYVTPQNSPVEPERFTGYHTGVDIEQMQDNTDVPVYAVNEGKVKFSGEVGGYGGVLIYETTINNQTVTILYGHIRLSSATKKVGDTVTKGEKLAVLGSPNSSETDGERKHLHFSIHKGSQIVYLGYVQNADELSNWINPDDIVK